MGRVSAAASSSTRHLRRRSLTWAARSRPSTDINEAGRSSGYASTETARPAATFRRRRAHRSQAHLPARIRGAGPCRVEDRRRRRDPRARPDLGPPGSRVAARPDRTTEAPAPLTIDASRPAPSSVATFGRFESSSAQPDVRRSRSTIRRHRRDGDVHRPERRDLHGSGVLRDRLRPTSRHGHRRFRARTTLSRDGGGVWHARFSPDETGTWRYTLRAQDHVPGQADDGDVRPDDVPVTPSAARARWFATRATIDSCATPMARRTCRWATTSRSGTAIRSTTAATTTSPTSSRCRPPARTGSACG